MVKRCPTSSVNMTPSARRRSRKMTDRLKTGAEATKRRADVAAYTKSEERKKAQKSQSLIQRLLPGTDVHRKKVRAVPGTSEFPAGPAPGASQLPMSDFPGTDIDRKKVRDQGMGPGLPGKGSLMSRLTAGATKMSPLATKVAKSVLSETGKRAKSFKLSGKSAIASLSSMMFLKKILAKLTESSGYLGAVFKILGKTLLMALMPIATVLGVFMMPFTLKILEVVRKMLTALKGPLADLIGGKISVTEFIAIALPIMADAFGEIGSILGDMIIGFLELIETVWPMVEPYFLKAFDAVAGFIEDRLWPILEPLLEKAFTKVFEMIEKTDVGSKLGSILGKVLAAAAPLMIIAIFKGLPAITMALITGMIALIDEFIGSMGLTWEEFSVGLAILFAGLVAGLAFVLAGAPVALAAAIAGGTILMGALAVKAAYEAGVAFGTFVRNLNDKLNGIPGLVWDAFTTMLNPLGVLKVGPLIYDAIKNMLPGGSSKEAPPATGYRDADKSPGYSGGTIDQKKDEEESGGLLDRIVGGIGDVIGRFRKILPFKEGGMTSSPTLGLLSENHQKEVVMPLDKMKGMGGGGNYNFAINIDKPQISSDMDLEVITQEISEKIYENIRRNTAW